MAPMTRSRAIGNLPNELMATYYGQRTQAGLIITEATAISADSLGYARIPGIFNQEQIDGWKKITRRVHEDGSKIFLQIVHTGRVGHNDNLPEGASLRGVSDKAATGQIFTDTRQLQDFSSPEPMSTSQVEWVIDEFVTAARNAIQAGFDGVELHGANGYLMEQFLNPHINNRTDRYGGSIANRARFLLAVASKVSAAIGKSNVGIRLSPYATLNDLPAYEASEVHTTYQYLAEKLNEIGLSYIHIAAYPAANPSTFKAIRNLFGGNIIHCNGLNQQTAEQLLEQGMADLVGFGRHFIANPDLVTRMQREAQLAQPDAGTFYAAGEQGYIDYSFLN